MYLFVKIVLVNSKAIICIVIQRNTLKKSYAYLKWSSVTLTQRDNRLGHSAVTYSMQIVKKIPSSTQTKNHHEEMILLHKLLQCLYHFFQKVKIFKQFLK